MYSYFLLDWLEILLHFQNFILEYSCQQNHLMIWQISANVTISWPEIKFNIDRKIPPFIRLLMLVSLDILINTLSW